jgi:hypothetical protein
MGGGQLVFLDESGDAGFKLHAGSSPVLVVAAVVFETPMDAEATAQRIRVFRDAEVRRGDGFQFHFTNVCQEWRLGLFRAVARCPFAVRAVVMHKAGIREGSQLRRDGRRLYHFTVNMLFRHALGEIEDAKVFIDGDAGRQSLRRMCSELRREHNTEQRRLIGEIKFVPKSANNLLVQLADMVTGGIARSYRQDRADRDGYRQALQPRIRNVWEFGQPGE